MSSFDPLDPEQAHRPADGSPGVVVGDDRDSPDPRKPAIKVPEIKVPWILAALLTAVLALTVAVIQSLPAW